MRRENTKERLQRVRRQKRIERRRSWQRSKFGKPAYARAAALRQWAEENGWLVLVAPHDLSWQDEKLQRLCRYLESIRRAVLVRHRKVVVDLSNCERLSSLACMMLAAEIERCQGLRPNSINGLDPRSLRARIMLHSLGFYTHLSLDRPPMRNPPKQAIQIRSGLGSDETIASDAHEVSTVANDVFPHRPNFAKRVHSALNEALGNVQMHAYGGSDGHCLTGRWWIAGLADHAEGEAYFFALDHGVGIPRTAPQTMGEAFRSRLAEIAGGRDHQILELVVNERRTRTGKAQHGKGIASMISLAEMAGEGEFHIFSGRGQYRLGFNSAASTEPEAFAGPLGYTFPGTLLIWRVVGPAQDTQACEDDEQGDQTRE
ncbi:hypothetical protein [Phenylobacterium sp.]|uniref:hypothetical protein n=1 Tax=Phenylobacterium sp. TaxID=1871053 RepID=UPI002811532D|nr:hypothetical protein [Phenylobacterium sp.]